MLRMGLLAGGTYKGSPFLVDRNQAERARAAAELSPVALVCALGGEVCVVGAIW